MKTIRLTALFLALVLLLCSCGEKPYAPAGTKTGNEKLDTAVLEVIENNCQRNALTGDNLLALYTWVSDEIEYQAAGGAGVTIFNDQVITDLAAETMTGRTGDGDDIAALLAVFLRRMGCKADVVKGKFRGDDDLEWVDHAWVVAIVEGGEYHFDPVYDRYFAETGTRSCFMANREHMQQTHIWQ